jgi:hypothetical protein
VLKIHDPGITHLWLRSIERTARNTSTPARERRNSRGTLTSCTPTMRSLRARAIWLYEAAISLTPHPRPPKRKMDSTSPRDGQHLALPIMLATIPHSQQRPIKHVITFAFFCPGIVNQGGVEGDGWSALKVGDCSAARFAMTGLSARDRRRVGGKIRESSTRSDQRRCPLRSVRTSEQSREVPLCG